MENLKWEQSIEPEKGGMTDSLSKIFNNLILLVMEEEKRMKQKIEDTKNLLQKMKSNF